MTLIKVKRKKIDYLFELLKDDCETIIKSLMMILILRIKG